MENAVMMTEFPRVTEVPELRLIRQKWNRIWSYLLSLVKRSFKTHGSVWVSHLQKSLEFYNQLGFRQVMTTRGGEVVLLRNQRGDELNIISGSPNGASRISKSSVSFEVDDLPHYLTQLKGSHPDIEITTDALSRRIKVSDPDGNAVELSERLDPKQLSEKNIYHIATHSELTTGLSEHYYLPQFSERRFIRASARSAFMSLACARVAQEMGAMPLIIELNRSNLNIEEQLFNEADFDSKQPNEQSTYPHVTSPIPRHAIIAVGECEEKTGEYPWPANFVSLDSLVASWYDGNNSVDFECRKFTR